MNGKPQICAKLPRFRFFTTVGGGLGIFGSESNINFIHIIVGHRHQDSRPHLYRQERRG